MPFSKDIRERRRRQNRESQQRRSKGQRQKQSICADLHDGEHILVGPAFGLDKGPINTPFIGLSPSPPRPDFSREPQPPLSYLVQDASYWTDYQPANQAHPQSSWPSIDMNPSTTAGIEQSEGRKEAGEDDGREGDQRRSNTKEAYTFPHFENHGLISGPQTASSISSSLTVADSQIQPSCSYLKPDLPATAQNRRVVDMDLHLQGVVGKSSTKLSTQARSPAEKAIREVLLLYRLGVKAGFLRKNDRVRDYLASMRGKYSRIPLIKEDDDCDGSSTTDSQYEVDSD